MEIWTRVAWSGAQPHNLCATTADDTEQRKHRFKKTRRILSLAWKNDAGVRNNTKNYSPTVGRITTLLLKGELSEER